VEDVAKEKKAVESVLDNFWKAYEAKDAAAMDKLVSPTLGIMFFGTDSAEVIKSTAQWEAQKKDDMQLFESFKAGEPRNVSTQIDSYGELASAICEIPVDMTIGGQMSHSLARFAVTMRNENGGWRIIQGMVAFATVGQSSAELVAKMKEPKQEKK
jgi:ketosteroid isomerase-like protein